MGLDQVGLSSPQHCALSGALHVVAIMQDLAYDMLVVEIKSWILIENESDHGRSIAGRDQILLNVCRISTWYLY